MKELILQIDPILYSRLETVHAFEKNCYNLDDKPPIEQWIIKELIEPMVSNEELRIANKNFYAQKTVLNEVPQPQIIRKPYVEPIRDSGPHESLFTDELAIELNILDWKQRSVHVFWECCNCGHCPPDEDDYKCFQCHSCCVCWCGEEHYAYGTYWKDGVEYMFEREKLDMKCPGHRECKSRYPTTVIDALKYNNRIKKRDGY